MPILRQWTFKINPNRQLPNLRETFSLHARVWMRVLVSTLILPRSNENKSCMHAWDWSESWEARVCMRVFSTLMPRSNAGEQELMRVEKREFASHVPVKREQELHESKLMRAEKREFAWEFSQLSCPSQTRTRVAWELMRVDWILPRDSENCYQLALKFEPVQSWWKLMRVYKSWRWNAGEGCNSHPRLNRGL